MEFTHCHKKAENRALIQHIAHLSAIWVPSRGAVDSLQIEDLLLAVRFCSCEKKLTKITGFCSTLHQSKAGI